MNIQKVRPIRKMNIQSKKKAATKNVAELKKKYKNLPLHFLFGIQKEIDHQCPIIDTYLDQINEVMTALEKIHRSNSLEDNKIQAAIGLHYLKTLSTDLDEITRKNFEKLRTTADEWKQLAIDAINATKTPEEFLNIK